MRWHELAETRDPVSRNLDYTVQALSHLGFDGQLMSHWDYGYGERRSGIVSNEGKHATHLVTAQHGVLVIRGVQHHVRVPRANSRTEVLVRREHIRECHRFPLRQLAFGEPRLNSFS